jgi:hypothetical protein
MFLGTYEYAGEPTELLAAYNRLMEMVPSEGLSFHACVERADGITIIDTCPSEEIFTAFSSSPELRGAMEAAGLPMPRVTKVGVVHMARTRDLVITD